MARIYLIRHAESQANTQGIYQGQTYDTSLSDLGRKQAEALGIHLSTQPISRVISSPLKRTQETAAQISSHYHLESRIIETNHGQWEGVSKTEIATRWPQLYQKWLTKPSGVIFPGGEDIYHTQFRTISWFQEIVDLSGTTAVVTHDNIIRIILCHIFGYSLDRLWQFDLHPAAVTTITCEDGHITDVILNETIHLQDLLVDVASHAL